MSRLTAILIAIVVCIIVSLGWAVNHYRDNAVEYKKQRDEKTQALNLANATIIDMTTRQRDVADLDAKYTKELADAQGTIHQLERDVAAGRRRLYLNANCTGTTDTPQSPSVAHATAATLTADAERDYWRLRAGIETVTKQVEGLQEYINMQCLK